MIVGTFGVVIHVIFLYSIFDIYFKSPIIHGMTPYVSPAPAPARRLVLFVADGLRADKLFEVDGVGNSRAPFLRNVVLNQGVWGISHTRVPTESRPGHVAIAAGIFEDVSAVTKGWKENPVDFDSVFNESRYTWAWGSPDILPMFSRGEKKNVFIDTYSGSEEDFAGANPSHLDTWVFDKVEKFLKESKLNSTISLMLSQDKIIFFLHLLGLDTTGHAYKPGSSDYEKNVRIVDDGVKKCVDMIEEFFSNDEKTAYVFTSDHGMTDWGSHGAGQTHETYTPFIAWGAGLRGPLGEGRDKYHDGFSETWKLSHTKRIDINQVDITPLIATLIGIPFPVNSLGVLPVEFLGTEWAHKAVSLLTNARQILANYKLKMKQKKETTLPIFFWNFRELSTSRQAELMSMIETLLKQHRYTDAIQVGVKVIELALKGMVYYEQYDRFALSFSIFLGFLGWMSYILVLILRDYTSFAVHASLESSMVTYNSKISVAKTSVMFIFISIIVGSLLYVQSSPSMYYVYFFLPVVLWFLVFLRMDIFQNTKDYIIAKEYIMLSMAVFIIGFISLELLVASYFRRELLSLILWGFSVWPFMTSLRHTYKTLASAWCIACIATSIFPLLPVVGRDAHYNLVILASWLSVFAVAFCARRPETGLIYCNRQAKKEPTQVLYITAAQVVLLIIAAFTVRSTSYSISNKQGLPIINQLISWLILVTSVILPLFGSKYLITRLLNVTTSFIAPYILMSISHEGLFCISLCVLLFLWLCIEHQLSDDYRQLQDIVFDASVSNSQRKKEMHRISLNDVRRAYFFIFFILVSFFGTGNIASINSFEPASVYCFLTVFNPYVMGFLMLLKVCIPFILVVCTLRAILVTLKASPRALFLLILLITDFMGLHFLFMVKDSGSWLEIGSSISHYVINMTVIIFVMLLYGLSWILTSCNLECQSFKMKRHLL